MCIRDSPSSAAQPACHHIIETSRHFFAPEALSSTLSMTHDACGKPPVTLLAAVLDPTPPRSHAPPDAHTRDNARAAQRCLPL
eukprot:2749431-Rhodomonas_salina.1